MITPATLDDMPRGPYRSRRDRRPEHRRAMYIGGGGISIPGDPLALASFNGNFASLFPGAYQVVQSDRGLTYGGTPLASGTTPPAGTLGGLLATTPVPIWFKCTTAGTVGAGAAFAAYADGLGVTPFQTGITPTAGVPVALSAPCTGLSMAWAAGTAALDNVWKATCSALADQTANAQHATQAVAAQQPVLTTGLNGKPGLLFDGVDDAFASTVGSLLTFPYLAIAVARLVASSGTKNALVGGTALTGLIFEAAGGVFTQYNGASVNAIAFANFVTPQRWSARFGNTGSDFLQIGATTVTGGNAGPNTAASRSIGDTVGGGRAANIELYSVIYTPVTSLAAFDAALNSAAGYGPGAIAV